MARLPLPRPGRRWLRRGGLGLLAGAAAGWVGGLLRAPKRPR